MGTPIRIQFPGQIVKRRSKDSDEKFVSELCGGAGRDIMNANEGNGEVSVMDYLFLNVRVCTPYELTGGAVLVRDGVIEGVFDHIDPPEGARVIDAGGRILAPG